jgi:hypothetical protein
VQVAHSLVAAAGIVVEPMGVLMPPRACWHTKPTTVGIPAIGDCVVQVPFMGTHLLQWVVSAAGMDLLLGGTVVPERV